MEMTSNPIGGETSVDDVDKRLIDELIRHTDNLTKILKSRRDNKYRPALGSVFTLAYWQQRWEISKIRE